MKLREYQQRCVDAVLDEFQRVRSTLVVCPTGGGKTVIFAHIIDRMRSRGRCKVIAHREELVFQARDKIERVTGIRPDIEMAGQWASERSMFADKSPVVVSTVQTQISGFNGDGRMTRFDPDEFSLLIIDECFPAGTPVDGRPIESIRVGDFVRSFNHANGSIEIRRVLRVYRSRPRSMCRVTLASGRRIHCTTGHPIYNGRKYVPAFLLRNGDGIYGFQHELHRVRQAVPGDEQAADVFAGMRNGPEIEAACSTSQCGMPDMQYVVRAKDCGSSTQGEARRAGVLLAEMRDRETQESIFGDDGQDESHLCVRPNEEAEPDAPQIESRQSVGDASRGWTPAPDRGREWPRTDRATTDARRRTCSADGVLDSDRAAARWSASDLLQGGHRRPAIETGHRSGWAKPPHAKGSGCGQTQRGLLEVDRVDRVEILERDDSGGFGGLCPDGCVYNIEVEGNHNYFVDGLLVHNCHHAVADSYKRVIDYYRRNPNLKVLGVTATPDRHDEEALGKVFESVAFGDDYGIVEMISDGWLVPIDQRFVPVSGLDLSSCRTTAGDLNGADLAKVLEFEQTLHGMVYPTIEIVGDRKTLFFGASVEQAERIAEIINRHRPGKAECIFGHTDKDRRRELLRHYATGVFQFLVNVGVACLDDQTEILTSDGWVGHDKISPEHKIANWEHGRIFFDNPLAIEVRDRRPDERMVVLETRNRSIRVTDDHRMLYRTFRDGPFKVCRAHELVHRKADLPISGLAKPASIVPEQDARSSRRLPANTYHLRRNGMDAATAVAVATERATARDALRYSNPSELTEAECEFIGFWLGDGTRSRLQSGGVEYQVCQAESYGNLTKWVDELLVRIGVDIRRRVKPSRRIGGSRIVQWSLSRGTGFGPQRRRGVYRLEPYLDKCGSELLWGLDADQFAALCRGFWMADGEHGDAVAPIADRWRICNTNRPLLDLLQAIACCRGYRANISDGITNTERGFKPLWTLSLSLRDSHAMTKYRLQFESGWKPEKVWCVKSHTGFIVTRRRGTVTITGNTEGFDAPDIDVVVMGRPTKSRALYAQMLGRGTRPLAGIVDGIDSPAGRRTAIANSDKDHLLVLDFVGNSGKHKLVTAVDILGGNYEDTIVERAKREIERKGVDANVSDELKAAEREQREEERRLEEAKRRTLKFTARYSTKRINPFDVLDIAPRREPGWHKGRRPTEKMLALLEKQGIETESLSFHQASRLITEIVGRWKSGGCSFKQAKLLKRHGYDTSQISRVQATKLIDALRANGWRRPPEAVA